MPSFEINFEVFCGTCGAGLCNQSDTRKSRHRGEDQVTVEVCQKCLDKETIPLQEKIFELEDQIQQFQNKISDLQDQIDEYQFNEI